jgi:hypothetical protein
MDINNRIATLDLIFQELKEANQSPIYISKRKYKITDEEKTHLQTMLSETGLVDVIEKDYHDTMFALNNKGVNELMKHGNYSDFLKERANPATQIQSNINEMMPPQKSILEIISWVVGSIAAIIAIYEFVIKRFI